MKGGVKKIWCLKCKEDANYRGRSVHRSRHHLVKGSDADELGKVDDDSERKDDDIDRPGHLCAGVGDAVSRQKEPKDGYRKKAKGTAPGRRQKDSSRDQGTRKAKKGKSSTQRKAKPG